MLVTGIQEISCNRDKSLIMSRYASVAGRCLPAYRSVRGADGIHASAASSCGGDLRGTLFPLFRVEVYPRGRERRPV